MSNLADDRFVVLAKFAVGPEDQAAFLEAARDDALQSRASEAGCLQFDVVGLGTDTVLFYEIYTNKAAFDLHLSTPHFQRFQDAVGRLNIPEPEVDFGFLHETSAPAHG